MKAKTPVLLLCALCLVFQSCAQTNERVKNVFEKLFGAERQRTVNLQRLSIDEYSNKLRGAWAGQMVGLSYADSAEFQAMGEIYRGNIPEWESENIETALTKEDLYVGMTLLQALRNDSFAIEPDDVAPLFAPKEYPLRLANFTSRENLRAGVAPVRAGHPSQNPYAYTVSYQNQSAVFGLITPGMYLTGAQMAQNTGPMFAYAEGIEGGKFVSALYSAVYFESTPEAIIDKAMQSLSPGSPYTQVVRSVLEYYRANPEDWKGCWDMLQQRWAMQERTAEAQGKPLNIEASFNAGYITLGLLYGYGDFARTLELTARCGQDSDSNTGIAAGVLGGLLGYRRIPSEYTIGIALIREENFLETEYSYETLITECRGIAEELIRLYGGAVQNLGDRDYYMVPIQEPRPL